ncbi:hypothetical protein BT69DRAFT_1332905 [Atractiella rhizophila]|nr:hypothetical protein BT69DRAFT_1332905 [Atractiella rhizophila]
MKQQWEGATPSVPRGLAFWYTARPAVPALSGASFFGQKPPFEGLGIVIDLKSDNQQAVISGVMDDGTGTWMNEQGTPTYRDNTIGECMADLLSSQGMIWVRVAHVNSTIRVDLDLSEKDAPIGMTASSGMDRVYSTPCLKVEGIELPPNYYSGFTGSSHDETETGGGRGSKISGVDVYQFEMTELVGAVKKVDPYAYENMQEIMRQRDEARKRFNEVNYGAPQTTGSGEGDNALRQLLLQQEQMDRNIAALAGRLSNAGGASAGSIHSKGYDLLDERIKGIEQRISDAISSVITTIREQNLHGPLEDNISHVARVVSALAEELRLVKTQVEQCKNDVNRAQRDLSQRLHENKRTSESIQKTVEKINKDNEERLQPNKLLFFAVFLVLVLVAVGYIWKGKQQDDWKKLV